MEKVRYEIDPHNRLILDESGTGSDLPQFRKVLDGEFRINEDNSLSYIIKSPLSKTDGIPNQLRLKGIFSMTDNYDLCLILDKQYRETFGDRLVLQGEILDVKADSLLFGMMTETKEGCRTYVLNIAGMWKASEDNRLSFYIKKERGRYDILTFNGTWEVDKNNRIIYRYEKADLVVKKKRNHALIFTGYWDIKDGFRISYILSKNTDSAFDFETSVAVFMESYIKYELGIGIDGRAEPGTIAVTLSGKWSLKKDTGLVFEIEYEGGRMHAIVFGADAKVMGDDTVSFRLMNGTENKDIGATLELSRRLLKGDGEEFLRLLASKGEAAIYAGAAWRW